MNAEYERSIGLGPLRDLLTKHGISETLSIYQAVEYLLQIREIGLNRDKEASLRDLYNV